MAELYKRSILLVDDDADVREILETLLAFEGYEILKAEDGLSALLQINKKIPDVIISDLNMPRMSSFEFLSVIRRRFPQIGVIASSGAYGGDAVPAGVIADAFYAKGESLNSLLRIIARLIRSSASWVDVHAHESAPVWIARNGKDSTGSPYIVLNCDQYLCSFPITVAREPAAEVLSTSCVFCPNEVKYIIDFSRSVTSPQKLAFETAPLGRPGSAA